MKLSLHFLFKKTGKVLKLLMVFRVNVAGLVVMGRQFQI